MPARMHSHLWLIDWEDGNEVGHCAICQMTKVFTKGPKLNSTSQYLTKGRLSYNDMSTLPQGKVIGNHKSKDWSWLG